MVDASANLSDQQREDITSVAQVSEGVTVCKCNHFC